ncbi:MAG: hypothetical protein WKG07_13410 [Hymenobacter sp.]
MGGAGAGYTLYSDTLNNVVGISQFFLYEYTRYLNELLRAGAPRGSTRLKVRVGGKGPVVLTGLLLLPTLAARRGQ